jgi:aromatic-L-amino-acid decarboxylase
LVEASPDFELSAPAPFSLVCFHHRLGNVFNQELLTQLNATGKAFLSHTVLNGRFVLRFAIGNFMTNEGDIRETWKLISELADQLSENPIKANETAAV